MVNQEKASGKVIPFLCMMVLAYALTAILLLGLAFLVYKFRFEEKVVNIAVIVIYVVVTFLSGFITGKKMKVRKFMWGFVLGATYFLVLTIISVIAGHKDAVVGSHIVSTFFLCAGGGMLGGMIS